jgi:hypothetical protein
MLIFISGTKCVYTGKETHCDVTGLHPCVQYSYKLRAYTEGDESPFSDPVSIVTEESGKSIIIEINWLAIFNKQVWAVVVVIV